MVQEIVFTRKFKYNGIELGDPNPALSADAVREFYSTQFPELTNSLVEGPTTKGTEQTYQFLRAVGAKAGQPAPGAVRERVEQIADGTALLVQVGVVNAGAFPNLGRAPNELLQLATRPSVGRPMHMPSEAYGIFG